MKTKTKLNRQLLKRLRAERGWSLDRAAAEIEISRQALHMIERGIVQPRSLTLVRIAKAYSVNMADFYEQQPA